LFAILAGMIQPFGDEHASIDAPAIGMSFHEFRLGIEPSDQSVWKVTNSAYLKSPMQKFCENQVEHGISTNPLVILGFFRFTVSALLAILHLAWRNWKRRVRLSEVVISRITFRLEQK
jgi:hypothetical protein